MNLPVALTCGDPNGIGIDISFEAKKELKNKIVKANQELAEKKFKFRVN